MRNYFDFRFKYGLLNKFSDVWNIKGGDIFEVKYKKRTRCYKAHGLFAGIYNFVLVGPIHFVLLFVFLYLPWSSISVGIFLTILIYFVFEFILIALVPMKEINCLEKKIEDKKSMENKWQY